MAIVRGLRRRILLISAWLFLIGQVRLVPRLEAEGSAASNLSPAAVEQVLVPLSLLRRGGKARAGLALALSGSFPYARILRTSAPGTGLSLPDPGAYVTRIPRSPRSIRQASARQAPAAAPMCVYAVKGPGVAQLP